MKSTGEVMGIDVDFGTAFAKSQLAAYRDGLPKSGTMFISVADRDKHKIINAVKHFIALGFKVASTAGTGKFLAENGITAAPVRKQSEGSKDGVPTTVEGIMNGDFDLVVNTPYGTGARRDGYEIRSATVLAGTPSITTVQGLNAAAEGIEALQRGPLGVKSIQEHAADLNELLSKS